MWILGAEALHIEGGCSTSAVHAAVADAMKVAQAGSGGPAGGGDMAAISVDQLCCRYPTFLWGVSLASN